MKSLRSRWDKRVTLVVQANAVDKVRELLRRNAGGGDGWLREECVGRGASSKAKATHYVLECLADSGMVALAENLLSEVPGVRWRVTGRSERVLGEEMDAVGIKRRNRHDTAPLHH